VRRFAEAEAVPANPGVHALTAAQAADFLGISVRTLYRLRKDGGGPIYAKFGTAVRYPVAALHAYIDESMEVSAA